MSDDTVHKSGLLHAGACNASWVLDAGDTTHHSQSSLLVSRPGLDDVTQHRQRQRGCLPGVLHEAGQEGWHAGQGWRFCDDGHHAAVPRLPARAPTVGHQSGMLTDGGKNGLGASAMICHMLLSPVAEVISECCA